MNASKAVLDLSPTCVHRYTVVFGRKVAKKNRVWSVKEAQENKGILRLCLSLSKGTREPLIRWVVLDPKNDRDLIYDDKQRIFSWTHGRRRINLRTSGGTDESFALAA